MIRRLFLAGLVTSAAVASIVALVSATTGAGAASLLAVGLAAAAPIAALTAARLVKPLRDRARAMAASAERLGASAASGLPLLYGDDELGETGRAFDAAMQALRQQIAELSRDRARMEAILSGMVEGVLVVDAQGHLQLVNRAARDMLRLDSAPEGRAYVEVIRHPEITTLLAGALRGSGGDSREVALARDPARTFVARAAPVARDGGGGAVLVLHDISHLRRADQIRRDFVANVSHELRTPLTAIRGYLEALLDEEPAGAAETRRFLEIASRHTVRMERLVTDLLRLARLDARQDVLEVARCDLHQLLEDVAADLQAPAALKRQHITIDVPAGARAISADRAKLHDALRNLVENAVHYAPDDTEIALAARREDHAIAITVADRGPGIPPEDLTRVFERFYRVDKSRGRPGGTGLGLAIARHLVELHQGTVAAANRPGGGAVFTVTLRSDIA